MGQFKTPFTPEFITSLTDVETADRSTVVDSIAPKRDIRIMADYAIGPIATLALGVFNGEGQNRQYPVRRRRQPRVYGRGLEGGVHRAASG